MYSNQPYTLGIVYRDKLLSFCFNMHNITRHVLTPDGATFQSRDEDFLVSDNLDFHPTDVHEDADGSLVVIDTGGWYKLCCPTSQLQKPDVLGAIYRVRRKDASKVDDPRGADIAWAKLAPEKLALLLGDARPAVRRKAIEKFGRRGRDGLRALAEAVLADIPASKDPNSPGKASSKSAIMRRNAVWALCRIDDPLARQVTAIANADPDESVRLAAAHSIGLWRDGAMLELLHGDLAPGYRSPHQRRVAAEALGRIGDKTSVTTVVMAGKKLGAGADPVVEHGVIFVLLVIAVRESAAG